jgi:phospholipase A-2-activating protein
MAPPDAVSAYETAVSTRQLEQSKELGGVKVNELPGPESLLQEGTEGQTRLVRHPDGKILCYQWTKGKWECVGDVMGAAGGTQQTSGKSLHEGKEYDYVFNVDIEDGKPPLKLPFNVSEDPWLAAQKFIHKNDLPQVYLEQVANFVITNAKLTTLPAPNTGYADPFTGGGRYVPSNGESSQSNSNVNVNFRERSGAEPAAVNLDPFTGGSSYSSGKSDLIVQKHIPALTLTTFETFDGSKIIAKLKEFNSQLIEENLKVTESQIDCINILLNKEEPSDKTVACARILMQWPNEKLFPFLDILRLAVRNKLACEKLAVIDYVIQKISTTGPNQLMTIRALSNMLAHEYGKNSVEVKINAICEAISNISQGTANLQNAIATFFLNQSILQKSEKSEEVCTILALGTLRSLEWISDPEATFKSYAALGNLITFNSSAILSIVKAADILKNSLERNRNAQYQKLAEISSELTEKLL